MLRTACFKKFMVKSGCEKQKHRKRVAQLYVSTDIT
jgi:hypothetical protein